MSRAFTKERDDAPEPEIVAPARTGPNYLTAAGWAQLRARFDATADARERERLQHSIDAAVVVEPPEDRSVVAFGATVVVSDSSRKQQTYTLVGEEEADVKAGKIGSTSPLAVALIGARAGDHVVWHRPAGDRKLTVKSITYA
ncbi:MAG: GreA/GreB family elongation factor [Candidatus Eremiobacteraeota bacterium]|nr:GreA/GreB family elongation factor [Candidatus Eremiobacteraeota bacterium]